MGLRRSAGDIRPSYLLTVLRGWRLPSCKPDEVFLKVLMFFPNHISGEIQSKNLYKIPLRNLVGRSIERPLKSPLVSKVITPPTSIGVGIAAIPVTHSLSLSRMEIKEIASRTRRELLGNGSQCLCCHCW